MKKLFILLTIVLLGLKAEAQRRRLVEVDADTLTKPSSPSLVGIASANGTFYLVPYSGSPTRMARYDELINWSPSWSSITGKPSLEPGFYKNTAFNKNFGTTAGTVLEGDYSPAWNDVTGKPSIFPHQSDFIAKFDSVKNEVLEWNNTITTPFLEADEGIIPDLLTTEITIEDQILVGNFEEMGTNGEALFKRGNGNVVGSLDWDSVRTSDIVGIGEYVRADTSNGRAVFEIPDHVADLIPDSSHFVIEPDYVLAYQVNTDFATVPPGYQIISVGLDSTELTLQKPSYDITYEIFCTCFDDTIIGYYDTIPYKVGILNSLDSITLYRAESILWFADTIWFDAGDKYKYSNYISNSHPIPQYRRKGNTIGARIAWDNKQKKFFIQ